MSEPGSNDHSTEQVPAAEEGIGAAAEQEGVVDQQAVLKDQIEQSDE